MWWIRISLFFHSSQYKMIIMFGLYLWCEIFCFFLLVSIVVVVVYLLCCVYTFTVVPMVSISRFKTYHFVGYSNFNFFLSFLLWSMCYVSLLFIVNAKWTLSDRIFTITKKNIHNVNYFFFLFKKFSFSISNYRQWWIFFYMDR